MVTRTHSLPSLVAGLVRRHGARFAIAAILTLVIGAGVAYGVFRTYSVNLPSGNDMLHLGSSQATRLYDRNGTLLYEIYGNQKRIVVGSDAISSYIKEATVTAEDARFYHHPGIDVIGIARAAIHDLRYRQHLEGGSTITQQLVKNTYLSPNRTFKRKIKEAIIALRLERHYTKDQILTMYLNQIGYGGNAYGIEAAAETYFGKPAKDVTLPEAATLAALPEAPTYYSPYGPNTAALKTRRDYILGRMADLGYISTAQAAAAEKVAITAKTPTTTITAPHFVMYVRQQLVDKYGEATVEGGGLQVTTTLDLAKQEEAEAVASAATKHLTAVGANNTAIVAIDPKSGEILAMVGSRDYFDKAIDGNVNVAIMPRSPGSAFKPIVYATGFEHGWAPGSTLFDLKTNFGDSQKPYTPKNYDNRWHGPVSVRQALANSYNIPAVKMLALVGKEAVLQSARAVGIATLTDTKDYGLSLAIGGGDVTLTQLAGAYGALANAGQINPPTAILKIVQNGKTLYRYTPKPDRVFRPETAYEISSILSDTAARVPTFGRVTPLNVANHTVAVKTGTSEDYRDAWTIGYTPSLVVGVWVGNNDNSPMRSGAAGAVAAAPIWHDYLGKLLVGTTDQPFSAPSDIKTVTVDAVTGGLPDAGTRATRRDIYAPWQMPSEVAKLAHYSVAHCQDGAVTTQTVAVIHSEQPNNPNWEKPVEAWARGHGYPTGAPADVTADCSPSPSPTPQVAVAPSPVVAPAAIPPPALTPAPVPSPVQTPAPSEVTTPQVAPVPPSVPTVTPSPVVPSPPLPVLPPQPVVAGNNPDFVNQQPAQ